MKLQHSSYCTLYSIIYNLIESQFVKVLLFGKWQLQQRLVLNYWFTSKYEVIFFDIEKSNFLLGNFEFVNSYFSSWPKLKSQNLSWNKLSSSGWTMRKIQHHPATVNKHWFQIKEYFFDYEKFQFRSNLIWTEIFSTLGNFFHKSKSETWCHKPMSWFQNRFARVIRRLTLVPSLMWDPGSTVSRSEIQN